MKRSELAVGAELYHAKPGTWQGNWMGEKVTVLHVEPYEFFRITRAYRATPDGKGNGVHVKMESWGETVVQLAHLRGPYVETLAAVERRRVGARTASDETAGRRRGVQEATDTAIDRARRAGVHSALNVTPYGTERLDEVRVSISLADLGEILEQLARLRELEH